MAQERARTRYLGPILRHALVAASFALGAFYLLRAIPSVLDHWSQSDWMPALQRWIGIEAPGIVYSVLSPLLAFASMLVLGVWAAAALMRETTDERVEKCDWKHRLMSALAMAALLYGLAWGLYDYFWLRYLAERALGGNG
jgi:hypothetical protein